MSTSVSWLAFLSTVLSLISPLYSTSFTIDAHQVHGVNSFNNRPLVDFSESSNIFPANPIHEIGVFTPGAFNASRIFKRTAFDRLVANIDSYDTRVVLGNPRGTGPFNVPIAQVPTISTSSRTITDRTRPRSFASSIDPVVLGGAYLSEEVEEFVTLEKWNNAVGRIRARCFAGRAVVRILLKHGLPNALYTVWDIGVLDPLTENESLSGGPFGGLPNVMVSDEDGSASFRRTVNYCPFDKCKGAKRCTLYISLFYHFDHLVYAAAPSLDFGGLPLGQVGSNQLQFFLNARRLSDPSKVFK